MKKNPGRNVRKVVAKISKKATDKIGSLKKSKKKTRSVKSTDASSVLKNAKKRISDIKKQSSKGLKRAKIKVHATEEEIVGYIKENPVKSISTVALAGLIAGFLSRFRK